VDVLVITDSDDLPAWLRGELANLARDFAHLSSDDRGGAILRNLSDRGWNYLDSRIAHRFAEQRSTGQAEGERAGAF